MTLKELRNLKGLTQEESAAFLGVTTRTYQSYENDPKKETTTKYKTFIKQLEGYDSSIADSNSEIDLGCFGTNVIAGTNVEMLYNNVKGYEKRDCYKTLKRFIQGSFDGKICILYGLRRTGKTTMLLQMLSELPKSKSAYIKVKTTDNMSILTQDLNTLYKMGFKYVFIDEITLLEDFISTAAVLSDIFSMMGMKIVVSGTDSLGFAMANRDELYDRSIMIHTSFISFKEYSRLLKITSIDRYIEFGGTLKMENMSFDDPDSAFDDVSFRDDESTRKYIDTAISRNIQHTLKNDNDGEYFNQLRELYEVGELTNVINRIVEKMNNNFLLSVIEEKFKSHDLGSAKNLLLHDIPNERAFVLSKVDTDKIIERLKDIIDVKEKKELKIRITEDHVEKVKKYLIMLDLIVDCSDRYESGKKAEHYVFAQPGMRYSLAKALVYSLMQDEYFSSISEFDKQYIIDKILNDVKGKMLEDIVLLEVNKSIAEDKEAFKFKFDLGGEFDMVIYNKKDNTCSIYEIKHSDKIVSEQTRHILNKEKCELLESKFGNIVSKYVVYRGEEKTFDNVKYINVEKYLCELS